MAWQLRCMILAALPIVTLPFSSVQLHQERKFNSLERLSLHPENKPEIDDEEESSFGLYVHIPYCRRRCNYCDFAIVPIGSTKNDKNGDLRIAGFENMDASYKNALLDEIAVIGSTTVEQKIRLGSIYFGGGTPSLAPLSTLQAIMHAILKAESAPFYLDEGAEVTIEMDPGTFNMPYLMGVKEMGFNRISLGVQSFNDDLLAIMGRVHRSADVYHSIDMIGQVFGEDHANYSIDLISGVPGLTLAGWAETLYEAVRLHPRPNHMSLYDLQVEKGTTFGKWYKNMDEEDTAILGAVQHGSNSTSHPTLPSAEDCAFMYSYASGYLRTKNYEHYEISSYAYRSQEELQHRSRHNQIYWQYGGQWYAIGLGATSNVNEVRYARPRALSDYISWTNELRQNVLQSSPNQCKSNKVEPPWLCKEDEENGDEEDKLLDIVMTRLRTSEGLDLDWVAKHDKYSESHVEAILRGFQLALELDLGVRDYTDPGAGGEHGYIRLTDPKRISLLE